MSASIPFKPAPFFALRTPTLPFGFLESWSEDPRPEALRAHLRTAVGRPEIRDALFLASPDLEAMLAPWLEGTLSLEKRDRVDRTLVRYLARMAGRCTPFGLFAGCSVGTWGATSHLTLEAWHQGLRHTRLDMDYLCALVEALEKEPAVREVLRYRPNTSLYTAAGRFRYAEEHRHPERGREYHLTALEQTPYLEATLQRAAGGAQVRALAEPLTSAEISLEEATAFIHQLIDSQVIVSELAPAVTGSEPLPGIIERLNSSPATAAFATPLAAARDAMLDMDRAGLGLDPRRYRDLAQALEALPAEIKLKYLFQVDLTKPSPGATLSGKVQAALLDAVDLQRRLMPALTPDPLLRFREAFRARYEERWVPLAEALDQEIGIGFTAAAAAQSEASPLLEDLVFPSATEEGGPPFTARDTFLLNRILELGNTPEWVLTDADLKALENPEPLPFPDSFACMASLAAASPEALDSGAFMVLVESYAGPSGARLLGRFCHGDPQLEGHVRDHFKAEAAWAPEVILAEVTHLPEGRLGNILCRPQLREYEIPYLGAGGAPEAFQLPIQDLEVTVRGARVVLRSRRLGKEVRPRLTSAHNHTRGISPYRFLCALQDQEVGSASWLWGPLEALPYLPRVRRGRSVLQRARWRVDQDEIKALTPGRAFQAFSELRAKRGFPRLVVLADGDNGLLVDLEHPLWVETLVHLVSQRSSFQLQEYFPGPGDLVAQGPEGRFCHELVVPFIRTGPDAPGAPRREVPQAPVPRSFLPGSEWLYLKIYTGPSTADRFLIQTLKPFLAAHTQAFDRSFFIRYADPDEHLRLRFQGRPDQLISQLLPQLHELLAPLQAAGWIWKVQVDTYERELERYGGARGILLAEDIFSVDSQAVLDLVEAYPGDEGAPWRWRMGLKAVDLLLEDLGFDLGTKARVIQGAREGFSKEFRSKEGLDIQLGDKFRGLRKELDGLLFGAEQAPEAQVGLGILAARSRAWRACMEDLRLAESDGSLLETLEKLAHSFAHMHLNRLLRAAQRAQEFVIYDYLDRLYTSRLARRR